MGLLHEIVGASARNCGIEGIDDNNLVVHRAIELADSIGANDSLMVRRYKRAIVEGIDTAGFCRERELEFVQIPNLCT